LLLKNIICIILCLGLSPKENWEGEKGFSEESELDYALPYEQYIPEESSAPPERASEAIPGIPYESMAERELRKFRELWEESRKRSEEETRRRSRQGSVGLEDYMITPNIDKPRHMAEPNRILSSGGIANLVFTDVTSMLPESLVQKVSMPPSSEDDRPFYRNDAPFDWDNIPAAKRKYFDKCETERQAWWVYHRLQDINTLHETNPIGRFLVFLGLTAPFILSYLTFIFVSKKWKFLWRKFRAIRWRKFSFYFFSISAAILVGLLSLELYDLVSEISSHHRLEHRIKMLSEVCSILFYGLFSFLVFLGIIFLIWKFFWPKLRNKKNDL
jgi:hypothetical protein